MFGKLLVDVRLPSGEAHIIEGRGGSSEETSRYFGTLHQIDLYACYPPGLLTFLDEPADDALCDVPPWGGGWYIDAIDDHLP